MTKDLAQREKPVFAVAKLQDGVPLVIVGVPKPAWEFMKDGQTLHFDLTAAGVPLRFLLFGGHNQFLCMKTLNDACTERGIAYLDERRRDWGIKTGHEGEPNLTTEKLPEAMTPEELVLAVKSLRLVVANMHEREQELALERGGSSGDVLEDNP